MMMMMMIVILGNLDVLNLGAALLTPPSNIEDRRSRLSEEDEDHYFGYYRRLEVFWVNY